MNISMKISRLCNAGNVKKNYGKKARKLSTTTAYNVPSAGHFTVLNQHAGGYWQMYNRKSRNIFCLFFFPVN